MTTTDTKPSVLFVCIHNAGRSQMAAGFLRRLAATASRSTPPDPHRDSPAGGFLFGRLAGPVADRQCTSADVHRLRRNGFDDS